MAANNDAFYSLFDVCSISQGGSRRFDPPAQRQLKQKEGFYLQSIVPFNDDFWVFESILNPFLKRYTM